MIAVRLPDDLAALIDARRGDVPRERWVRSLIARSMLDVVPVYRPPVVRSDGDESGFLESVQSEIQRGRDLYPLLNSPHEAYAVILEELDEFWDEVKRKDQDRDAMYSELVQVAAMAARAATETL